MKHTNSNQQIFLFNEYYRKYYPIFTWRCTKALKDEVIASGIVQDAFLKIWVLWDRIQVDEIYGLLKSHSRKAIFDYYDTAKNRFHSDLFRLDELENSEFLLGFGEVEIDELSDSNNDQQEEYQEQWQQLQQLIPSLSISQQQLIQLCLKYNFSYDRMSYYMGGISDYVVAKQVEVLLQNLRKILKDGERLERAVSKSNVSFKGSLDELQTNVMRMRYELQYSFADIASKLNFSEVEIKQAYANAHRTCR
ncbi:MAG: sigma-70 family RNA polymerase sigma factor [Pedobacter sp.]|nr:MAG: sigma-70 family RNA polymerase sigma factor [Pedobacter sp.]